MLTSNKRVEELVKYIKEKNPNDIRKEMTPDVKAVNLVSGSSEYIKWIKKQTEDT